MAFCEKCGKKLNEAAVFCGSCGAKTAGEQNTAQQAETGKTKVGIIIEVDKNNEPYGKFLEDKLTLAVNKSGNIGTAMGFNEFFNAEFVNENTKMESSGKHYEVIAHLAKRFGARYACMLFAATDSNHTEINTLIYDANDDQTVHMENIYTDGHQAKNVDIDNLIDNIVAFVSKQA